MKQINYMIAGIGTLGCFLFGNWDISLQVLVTVMVLDLITGILCGWNGTGKDGKGLDSNVMFKGLSKKFMIIIVLILGVLLDRLLFGGAQWMFRTVVCWFYIANESLSILENAGKLGLPVPKKLLDRLEQMKEEQNKEEGN